MRIRRIHNRCFGCCVVLPVSFRTNVRMEKKIKIEEKKPTVLQATKPHFHMCVPRIRMPDVDTSSMLYYLRRNSRTYTPSNWYFINYVEYVFDSLCSSAVHYTLDRQSTGERQQQHRWRWRWWWWGDVNRGHTKYIFSFIQMIVCSFHFVRLIRFASF